MTHRLFLLRRDMTGATIVEFALVAPLLLALLGGIVTYGGWFWMAHTLQQAANDAARATLAGLNATERSSIATAAVRDELRGGGAAIDPSRAIVTVEEGSEMVTVQVRYDAGNSAFLSSTLVPLPGRTILRTAVVRLATP